MMTEIKESKTLFVRNLPYSVKTDELEDKFSEYGPINQCFIVNDKETGKSRGFGYVKFTSIEDARKAQQSAVSLQGRKLSTYFADISRKIRSKPRKQKETMDGPDVDTADLSESIAEKSEEKIDDSIQRKENKEKKDKKNASFLAGQLSKQNVNQPKDVQRRFKVIVRNLSFQCTETQLQNAFLPCGEITEVKIPTSSNGKKLGFGFVQFSKLPFAQKAVKEMNAKKILGRSVAVDWALPKDRYEQTQQQLSKPGMTSGMQVTDEEEKGAVGGDELKDNSENESDEDDDSDGESDGKESSESVDDEENVVDNDEDDSDEEDEDEEEDDEDDDEEDISSDVESYKGNDNLKQKSKMENNSKSDTDDGCTLFLRNLSFDTTEEGMEEYFEQYGELKYAKVVYSPETEHSKGIGFVRFSTRESAEHCLEDANEGRVTLDGRQLIIAVAVSRERAQGFNEKKEKEKKDNRNLYLAGEGMIRAGTKDAEGLSKVDLDKRMKVEEMKRSKLKNVNVFISPFRLCVRNIPVNVDDKSLRETFKKAAGDKTASILECRIMRDRARTNAEGLGKSLGYGFVRFSEHQHALAALKHTNNSKEIYGDKKRLIVEFSLENRKALEAQETRKAKIQAKMSKKEGSAAVKPATKSLPLVQLSEKDKKLKGDKAHRGLPSHWGPKIRHKPRPSQLESNKKTKKNKQLKGQKRKETQQIEGPAQKKRKASRKNESYDDFDKMVNKYKNKLKGRKTGGWFE